MCDADFAESPEVRDSPQVSRRALLLTSGVAMGAFAVGIDLSVVSSPALAAGTYLRPCGNVRISSSWQGHKNRTPPSAEPGTDYAVGMGTPVRAATSGVIVDRKDTTTSATGRYIALQGDGGDYFRYLHLQSSAVPLGRRVARGDIIAYSGASGFGSDYGYGAHVHVSMWRGTTPFVAGFANSVDFELYVGDAPTPPDNSAIYRRNNNMTSFFKKTEGGTLWALAGDGTGKAAWIEITSQAFAEDLTKQHGPAALIKEATFNDLKRRYTNA